MTSYWHVRYEPGIWWALNNGICCYADTLHELIAEIAASEWKRWT